METKLIVLIKYLPQLQALGATSIKIDGVELEWRTPPAPPAEASPPVEEGIGQSYRDPLDYGLRAGTKMPSLRDPRGR